MQQTASMQQMARINPKRPKGSPERLTLPWLEGTDKRFFDADLGFVPVGPVAADMLKRVHCDGELTERGGEGPLLFEVVSAEHAKRIVQVEEKRLMLAQSTGNAGLKSALAGEWSDEDLENLGVQRPTLSALDALNAAKAKAATATQPGAEVAPDGAVSAAPAAGRVGRRPPKGKAPLPGSAA